MKRPIAIAVAVAVAAIAAAGSPAYAQAPLFRMLDKPGTFPSVLGMARDGSHIIFATQSQLVRGDRDLQTDFYDRTPTGVKLLTKGHGAGMRYEDVSVDGRTVVVTTRDRLVRADNNAAKDVYALSDGKARLISRDPDGMAGRTKRYAKFIGMSLDARAIAFQTTRRLVRADHDNSPDIYLARGGKLTLISRGPAGGNAELGAFSAGRDWNYGPVSADGHAVVFGTYEQLTDDDHDKQLSLYRWQEGALRLFVGGDLPGAGGIYMRVSQLSTDASRALVTTDAPLNGPTTPKAGGAFMAGAGAAPIRLSGATSATGMVLGPVMSADGHRVFYTASRQVTPDDTDTKHDLYMWHDGTYTRISAGPSGGNGDYHADLQYCHNVGTSSFYRCLGDAAPDGRVVVFHTLERLLPEDTDDAIDAYAWVNGTLTLASAPATGVDPMCTGCDSGLVHSSEDARRLFIASRERLTIDDQDFTEDLFLRTSGGVFLVSQGPDPRPGIDSLSYDGTVAVITTTAPLDPQDTNGMVDRYVVDTRAISP
jgi:hypothetical protein